MVGNALALRRRVVGFSVCLALVIMPIGHAGGAESVPLSRFGPDGSEGTNFNDIGSVAVDQQSGTVYVLDGAAEALFKFGPAGEPLAFSGANPDISGNRINGIKPFTNAVSGKLASSQVAIDPASNTVYVTEEHVVRAFHPDGEPAEFSAGPGAGTNELAGFTNLFGVAVDANGSIYTVDGIGEMRIFAESGAPVTTVPLTDKSLNLVVRADGLVYLLTEQNAGLTSVVMLKPSAFPVTESTTYTASTFVNGNTSSEYTYAIDGIALDPISNHVYLLETNFVLSYIREYDESGLVISSIGEPGTTGEENALGGAAQGLAVLGEPIQIGPGQMVKVYAGDKGEIASQVVLLGTNVVIGAPSVSSLRVTEVTADSAVLRALVNPNTGSTSYRFEYGLEDCSVSACASVPVGGANIGAGTEEVAVLQAISGLNPATMYHFRIVAENSLGSPSEAAGTFTTQAGGLGFELSDSRVWEMVSPPNKRGASLLGAGFGLIQASADGKGIGYLSRGSIDREPEGNRNLEPSQIVAKRTGSGWSSKDIIPSNDRTVPLAVGYQAEYKLFTPDLSTSLLDPRDGTGLSPLTTERTPYLRDEAAAPTFTPLVTGAEGVANVPAGRQFGGNPEFPFGDVKVAGADQDLEHIALFSSASLVEDPDAPPALYLWEGGQLDPVSKLPILEGGELADRVLLGSGPGSVRNAVSEDGSRIFWSTGLYSSNSNALEGLYLRDRSNDETVRLDTVRDGTGTGQARPLFQGANPSGTVAYFTDSQHLTADASPDGWDLYRCEIPVGTPAGGCATLTNLTGPAVSGGESAEVLHLISGFSEGGRRLYFVAQGVLSSNENQFGDSAELGEPNLFFWEEGAGLRFIATLSEEDEPDWGGRFKAASQMSVMTSPGGRYLGFMSQRGLTGQSNKDLTTGKPVEHVFVYDAVSDQLQCISCNPTGSASPGQIAKGLFPLVDPQEQWLGQRIAATLPQPTVNELSGASLYRPRALFDNGRLFFNSLDGLVSADSNNQWDVYQFQPLGQGTCDAFSGGSAVARSGDGCVSLISSGTAAEESGFLDASATGDDAFFLSPGRLSVLDRDGELDVYDARVGGKAAEPPANVECQGESCRPSLTPPAYTIPNSSAFSGKGNLHPSKKCPKGKKKVRKNGKVHCVPRKHSKGKKRPRHGNRKGRLHQ